MGCGKSSVGRRLSELLCCRFMDLDEVIEKAEGRTIPEIFASDGEGAFRRMRQIPYTVWSCSRHSVCWRWAAERS